MISLEIRIPYNITVFFPIISRDRHKLDSPVRQYISTKSFDAEHCFQQAVLNVFSWFYFKCMCARSDCCVLSRLQRRTGTV